MIKVLERELLELITLLIFTATLLPPYYYLTTTLLLLPDVSRAHDKGTRAGDT